MRGRLRLGPRLDNRERRKNWIRSHVRGHSFADIGGLYGIHGEHAFVAEAAGASGVTLFDVGDAELSEFPARKRQRGSSVRYVQGDLEDPVSVERIGPHDIVWCTGVIYHTPNPVGQLLALRRITRGLLYLGTHTIPEIPGIENGCVYYPYLSDRSRRAYASPHRDSRNFWAIGIPFNDKPMFGYANFWWGISP